MSGKNASDNEPIDLPLSMIRTGDGTQSRVTINQDVVQEYTDIAIENEVDLPPVEVLRDKSGYYLWDGFHRVEAYKVAGRETIKANVQKGSVRDARLKSCGANGEHGLRRNNEDKRRAVMTLLEDPEWCKWTNRKIADACHVSHTHVDRMRKELENGHVEPVVEQLPAIDAEPTAVVADDDPAPRPASTTRHSAETRKPPRDSDDTSEQDTFADEPTRGVGQDSDLGTAFMNELDNLVERYIVEGLSSFVVISKLDGKIHEMRDVATSKVA